MHWSIQVIGIATIIILLGIAIQAIRGELKGERQMISAISWRMVTALIISNAIW